MKFPTPTNQTTYYVHWTAGRSRNLQIMPLDEVKEGWLDGAIFSIRVLSETEDYMIKYEDTEPTKIINLVPSDIAAKICAIQGLEIVEAAETMTGTELQKVVNIILAREWNDQLSIIDWNNTCLKRAEAAEESMGMDKAMFEEMLCDINSFDIYGINDINYYKGVAQELHSIRGMLNYINNSENI